MQINAQPAMAADFDTAAQKHESLAWCWAIIAGVVYYFFEGWAVIPAILCISSSISSIGATQQASALREGISRISNPNNGARGSDFSNYEI